MLVCSIILLVVTMPSIDAYLPNRIELWIIYLTIFCIGIARGFYAPTGFSLMSEMIPKEHYPNSATWHSSSWQLATIVGPAAGGLLYGYFGATACFLVIVACMFISLVAIAFFVADHPPKFTPKENIFKSLLEGVQFVWKSKLMLSALSLDLFSVFFGGAVALMPIFADEILKVGAQGLGLLRAAPAIGAVLTMTLMTYYSPMNKPWRNLLLVLAGFGASIVCFGLSRNFYLSLAFLFCEGAFDSVSVIIRTNILQLLTPEGMRGRVSAVSSMFIGSSNELGAFESGVSARLMGVVPSVLFGGGMTLLIVGYTYLKTKAAFGLNTATFGEISAK
jgi:MFS family permease